MKKSLWSAMLLTALLAGCARETSAPVAAAPAPEVAPVLTSPEARDIHSFAQPAVARVTHVDLDLAADFNAHTLAGTATLDVLVPGDGQTLMLDTNGLDIEGVTDTTGNALTWTMGKADEHLGSPLQVQIGKARRVVVKYHTRPAAQALQWLTPAQTAGKQHPYLYSQGESIMTRSWVPTQDSPGIRQTWNARIVAPTELTVVMSGEKRGVDDKSVDGRRAWRFSMQHPVAPYLIAIAIGELAFQPLSARTGVYTEPGALPAAAAELADLEKMVSAAESLYGPYRWDRYDVLVLPPSFPMGGMENPRLTFATPTMIAGDKSLVSLIAHELAHSWSGNLVTNATWADFWLNEGFTDYFMNRILELVYGREAAEISCDLAWDDLQAEIKNVGGLKSADTRLHIDLAGRDPDDGQTQIPYDKGSTLLRTIEAAVGRERWDAYLRSYFDRHAFQPQTSAGFLADLRENLIKGDQKLEQQLGLDDWVYGTGLPANAVHIRSALLEQRDKDAAQFVAKGPAGLDAGKWSSPERVRFLNRLPRKLPAARLGQLRELMGLDTQHNSEVRFAWLRLAVANRYEQAVPQMEEFLMTVGRRKFVRPLFTDLMAQGDWGRKLAQRIYPAARPLYHSMTTGPLDKIIDAAAAH